MTPNQSENELRNRLGMPLSRVDARKGVDTVISFYAQQQANGVIEEDEGDMLVVQ